MCFTKHSCLLRNEKRALESIHPCLCLETIRKCMETVFAKDNEKKKGESERMTQINNSNRTEEIEEVWLTFLSVCSEYRKHYRES